MPPEHQRRPRRGPNRDDDGADLGPVRLIHEDDDVIVVDKPPGLLTADPAQRGVPNLFALLRRRQKSITKRRESGVWIIHRLDKDASGLLVFAKTERAFESLKAQFKSKKPHRIYCAVVAGELAQPAASGTPAPAASQAAMGTIQTMMREIRPGVMESVPMSAPLPRSKPEPRRGPEGREGFRGKHRSDHDAPEIDSEFRRAVTHYRVVASGNGRTLVRLRLETGLKNQIRVHLSGLGHPICGDEKYGTSTRATAPRLCLHATELGFVHPATGEVVRFTSAMPPLFSRLIGRDVAEDTGVEPPTGASAPKPARTPPAPALRSAAASSQNAVDSPASQAQTPPSSRAQRPTAPASAPTAGQTPDTARGWDHVAGWYDDLLSRRGSDHHEDVILPGVLRLVDPKPGDRILDVACGEGELCRRFRDAGADVTGVDLAPTLIAAAAARDSGPHLRYIVGDARRLNELDLIANAPSKDSEANEALGVRAPISARSPASVNTTAQTSELFDAITCVMAIMNIAPFEPVFAGAASLLKPGGRLVFVILHPAFRSPGQTSWAWGDRQDGPPSLPGKVPGRESTKSGMKKVPQVSQFRRIDAYLSAAQKSIVMNPGEVSGGVGAVTTTTFHRPLMDYVAALRLAGLLVDALEEWASNRRSEPGPRANEEDRIRHEIPLFAAIRATKPRV
jgi:23S rRNA-/tRNA-specific pseudouridylate synthase/SAM-dependent methyltransferase